MDKYLNTIIYNFAFAVVVLAFGAGYSLDVAKQQEFYKKGIEAGRISVVADRLEKLNMPPKHSKNGA